MKRARSCLLALLAVLASAAAWSADPPPDAKAGKGMGDGPAGHGEPPQASAGPYTILVERVTQGRTLTVVYGAAEPAPQRPSLRSARTVQIQLALRAADSAAALAFSSMLVTGLSAERAGRPAEISFYGNMLDSLGDGTLLRAYLYSPSFHPLAEEIRALEGRIVAFEQAREVEIELPVRAEGLPVTAEKSGLRAALRELEQEGGTAQLTLRLEAPPGGALVSPSDDGTYGVALFGSDGKEATPTGGSLMSPRPHQAELRVGFEDVKGPVSRVTVRVVHRSGARRSYPFRIERIPTPLRAARGR